MPLTVPRRYPRCLPFFLFVASYLFYIPSSLYCNVSCSCLCLHVVPVNQKCGRWCLCCVGVFVVVSVVLNAVFPDHSYVFSIVVTTVLFVPCGGRKTSPRAFNQCCYCSILRDCITFLTFLPSIHTFLFCFCVFHVYPMVESMSVDFIFLINSFISFGE